MEYALRVINPHMPMQIRNKVYNSQRRVIKKLFSTSTKTEIPAKTEPPRIGRPKTDGKFFKVDHKKLFLKGVSYGPFKVGSHGHQFPEKEIVARDFEHMQRVGVNCIRTYTPPPEWLLVMAEEWGLWVMAGIPWTQHVTFLDSPKIQCKIRDAVRDVVNRCKGHRSLFCYMVGNEISPDIIRWHGARKVQTFLKELCLLIRSQDPTTLISYANFPSAEYLELDCIDFYCFNVYLHKQEDFQKYLGRLQNLAGSKPLVLSEFGADSIREGENEQARIVSQKLQTSFEMGAAGTVVFSWTDEWFTGGHEITDWAFGVVTRDHEPKQAQEVLKQYYQQPLPPLPRQCPKVSVVVCAYNADRTIDTCLAALEQVRYPNYEVIVVNDGSNDGTLDICQRYPYIQLICQENKGLSVARNVGLEAATGEIVAYTDADCDVDPDWLTYLVHSFRITGQVAVGGPNLPPPEDALVPSAVAVSPGGPTHVLLDDLEAEHIAGCNMAFRTEVLRGLGGFDPQFRAAGDDVDICWRIQDAGYSIGFSPAAQVWHFRRNTVKDYFSQQRGYGKAEAMVYFKHPERFNLLGQASWRGRIYGDFSTALFPGRPFIYSGIFGMAPFQSLYQRPTSMWIFLPQTLEWGVFSLAILWLSLIGAINPLLGIAPLLASLMNSFIAAWRAPVDPRFTGLRSRLLITYLILMSPLARSWERYKWRHILSKESTSLHSNISLSKTSNHLFKDSHLAFWTQEGMGRDILLKAIIHKLRERKLIVSLENGWRSHDFRAQNGFLAGCEVTSASEIHGGYEILHRLRFSCKPSGLAIGIAAALASLLISSILTKQIAPSAIFAALNVGLILKYGSHSYQLRSRITLAIEESAKEYNFTKMKSSAQ